MNEQQRVVVTLRPGEAIRIDGIRVTVQAIPDRRAELVIEAPAGTNVVREERQ